MYRYVGKLRILIFIGACWANFSLMAKVEIEGPQGKGGETFAQATNLVNSLKTVLPSGQAQCVVDRVMALVAPEAYQDINKQSNNSNSKNIDNLIGFSNYGINAYYNNLMFNHSCLQNSVRNFWNRIGEQGRISSKLPNPSQELSVRPNITEMAGSGRFSNLKPGWLWKEALKEAKGDSNLAMMFLGVCGNDDVETPWDYKIPDHEARDNLRQQRDNTKKLIEDTRREMQGKESNSDAYKYLAGHIRIYEDQLKTQEETLAFPTTSQVGHWKCPGRNNAAYAPGSVDETFNIPSDQVNEIVQAQRPDGKNISTLAAKAYHFVGGALIGCELARCGLSENIAAKVAGQVAMLYRGFRLCPTIQSALKNKENMEKRINLKNSDPNFPYRVLQELSGVKDDGKPDDWGATVKFKTAQWKWAENSLVEMDAAVLYSQWYLGGPAYYAPCTGIRLAGPENLNPRGDNLGSPSINSNQAANACGIAGWTGERCMNARRKLYNWDLDIKWTQSQHEIGAKFGASKCTAWEPEKSIEKICSDSRTRIREELPEKTVK